MGVPTQPNRTGKSTASDTVFTPIITAKRILDYFNPQGNCLEPCKGAGAFFDLMPDPKDWCEITEGKDFLLYEGVADWIITNPPYSIYDDFLAKCFQVAENVVLFVPVAKAFKSMKVENIVRKYGGLREIVFMGGGGRYGFGFGFPVGCLYYKKAYKGDCKITYWD